ncbi:Ppx/GppA phosphatase family protein [Dethiosulfovibrio salsuginis]|uniref:Exopolyphosphatase / guanosine-5'-triphosphate,3'-diphosphate pyrophosphatase n=1 Tax=Dethiosulfovibrio salsuginis TaxID=561720 RepID=A0A1X7L8A9_9BACT|nr:hypothetical protein [Dethiosulfovibrio salsuginis]SMG49787.1 exopolyphosphatase / guanosine-5'-triphosphate,3'-diphosphate pyrophosphatase [Dethiosulfovibrio salsuginis]
MSFKTIGLVEIGTNSVKFLISYLDDSGKIVHLVDKNDVTKIGQGIESQGLLDPTGMERTLSSIEGFIDESVDLEVGSIKVVGTMALRKASNSEFFSRSLMERTGLSLQVLSGETEARYSLRAVRETVPDGCSGWLFDAGGGSTEFSCFSGKDMESPFSLNVGALTLSDRFFPDDMVDSRSLEMAMEWVASELKKGGVEARGQGGRLIGTGGNLVSMASVFLGGAPIPSGSSFTIPLNEIERQVALFAKTKVDDRSSIPGVPAARARIILGGACIALSIARLTCSLDLEVSTYGLRHGLMKEMLSSEGNFV